MLFRAPALLVAAASLAAAQTPDGFVPQVTNNLPITYGQTAVTQAGQQLPQPDLGQAPTIKLSAPAQAPKGVLFMIDLDVPRQGQRVNLLHWLATDVDLAQSPVTVPTTGGAPYLRPNPPAGDTPHRYVFLMFEQPQGFAIPAKYSNINPPATVGSRIGFDLTAFASDTSLRAPIAANFITVQSGRRAEASMTFPPAGGSTGSSNTNGTVVMSSLGASATGPAATGAAKSNAAHELAPIGLSFLAGLAAIMV